MSRIPWMYRGFSVGTPTWGESVPAAYRIWTVTFRRPRWVSESATFKQVGDELIWQVDAYVESEEGGHGQDDTTEEIGRRQVYPYVILVPVPDDPAKMPEINDIAIWTDSHADHRAEVQDVFYRDEGVADDHVEVTARELQ